jgi:peptidoglycan L-alanyl-D-glutamate endopeptidase CwlK
MASRDLNDLHPKLKPIAEQFILMCKLKGIDVLIYCTYRSSQEQEKEYAKGRTLPGPKTTYARPGQSKHNFRMNGEAASKAFDCVPMQNGKAIWDSRDPLWKVIGQVGKDLGLNWAGDWIHFVEYPHFELKD